MPVCKTFANISLNAVHCHSTSKWAPRSKHSQIRRQDSRVKMHPLCSRCGTPVAMACELCGTNTVDKAYLGDKKLWFQFNRCRCNVVLASPLSKGRISKLSSPDVSLMSTLGRDASAGENILKTLIYVNYHRTCVFKTGIKISEQVKLSSSFSTISRTLPVAPQFQKIKFQ